MSPKINHIGCGARGHARKSRNHRNEGFEGSHITKSKSYKFEMEQNNLTELLSISLPLISYNICPNMAEHFPIMFPVIFL